jgi:ATP-binding cassette, subfamily C, bacterial CydCD
VRPSDPRLRRQLAVARAPLAGVLTAGLASSGLVLAQAWAVTGLLMAVLGDGALLPRAVTVVVVLGLRGASSWASDGCAARAAARVGQDLRRRIVTAVLRRTAAGESVPATGEVAALATRGVAEAEPYLTRYLPAVVLAAVLPALTVVAVATQDLLSAAIILLTLPLVPVFGALVGLATRDRADRQWRAMS